MTKLGMSLGATPAPTQPRPTQSGIDWTAPQFSTPHPAPKRVYGRHVAQHTTVPQLPERTVRVRARAPATAYTKDGVPIPSDQWTTVPISPGLIEAEKRGDIEFDKGDDEPETHVRRHKHSPPPITNE